MTKFQREAINKHWSTSKKIHLAQEEIVSRYDLMVGKKRYIKNGKFAEAKADLMLLINKMIERSVERRLPKAVEKRMENNPMFG